MLKKMVLVCVLFTAQQACSISWLAKVWMAAATVFSPGLRCQTSTLMSNNPDLNCTEIAWEAASCVVDNRLVPINDRTLYDLESLINDVKGECEQTKKYKKKKKIRKRKSGL